LKKRIFSTLILWIVVVICFFVIGPDAAVWLLAVLSLGSQYEFYGLLEKMGRRPFKKFGVVLGTVMIIVPYYANLFTDRHVGSVQSAIIAVTIVACCLRILKERKIDERIESLSSTLLGLIYIPFMLSFLVRMIELPAEPAKGLMLVVWLIVTAKFTDVGALLFGKAFGRHPMSPNTSPKKTWEGAIGGCFVSVALGFALTYFARDYFPMFFTPLWGTLLALPIAVIAIISDLVESMLKRMAEEKDSGSFIPGIGGAFDLTDSLILSAPTGYLLFGLLI
jgi:phosphatidate cytidylyltransferase|tara:strand:+ start:1900 stop:2736 length:837 start_codon:yes stop_codon:yes gene_type:complete